MLLSLVIDASVFRRICSQTKPKTRREVRTTVGEFVGLQKL